MKMNKNTCMRFLNEQEIKGPFSCAEGVKRSMDSCEETQKINRMDNEVRYAQVWMTKSQCFT